MSEIKRMLTGDELKAIRDYNLSPAVEKVVSFAWANEKEVVIKSKSYTLGIVMGICLIYLVIGIIWANWFFPHMKENPYVPGILNFTQVIIAGVYVFLTGIYFLQLIGVASSQEKFRYEKFKKYALDIWQGKKPFAKKLGIFNKILIFFGLIFNGFWLAFFVSLIADILGMFIRFGIKTEVQDAMERINIHVKENACSIKPIVEAKIR